MDNLEKWKEYFLLYQSLDDDKAYSYSLSFFDFKDIWATPSCKDIYLKIINFYHIMANKLKRKDVKKAEKYLLQKIELETVFPLTEEEKYLRLSYSHMLLADFYSDLKQETDAEKHFLECILLREKLVKKSRRYCLLLEVSYEVVSQFYKNNNQLEKAKEIEKRCKEMM